MQDVRCRGFNPKISNASSIRAIWRDHWWDSAKKQQEILVVREGHRWLILTYGRLSLLKIVWKCLIGTVPGYYWRGKGFMLWRCDPDCLTEFIACRLIPLDKGDTKEGKPGVRPIGDGEVLRRLIGKLVIGVIKEDIITAVGPLRTCSGLKADIESAIHAMRKVSEDDDTEAILFVDAENAFNNLNRKALLYNKKQLCPPFFQYLFTTYVPKAC